jgi:hypothetical protein
VKIQCRKDVVGDMARFVARRLSHGDSSASSLNSPKDVWSDKIKRRGPRWREDTVGAGPLIHWQTGAIIGHFHFPESKHASTFDLGTMTCRLVGSTVIFVLTGLHGSDVELQRQMIPINPTSTSSVRIPLEFFSSHQSTYNLSEP